MLAVWQLSLLQRSVYNTLQVGRSAVADSAPKSSGVHGVQFALLVQQSTNISTNTERRAGVSAMLSFFLVLYRSVALILLTSLSNLLLTYLLFVEFDCDLLLNTESAPKRKRLLSNSELEFSEEQVNFNRSVIMPGTRSGSSRSTAEQCDELRRKMQLLGM